MDLQKISRFWGDMEKATENGPEERAAVVVELEKFIAGHSTCALATADLEGFVRCTPVDYVFMDKKFWILTEGGLKFRGLAVNSNVSVAVFDQFTGFDSLAGLQIMGTAEVVDPYSEEYLSLMKFRGTPPERVEKLQKFLNLVKITPSRYIFLCSALKKQGYKARQVLESL